MSQSFVERATAPLAKVQEELEEGEIRASSVPSAPSPALPERTEASQAPKEKAPDDGPDAQPRSVAHQVTQQTASAAAQHEHEEPHPVGGDKTYESDGPDDSCHHVSIFAQSSKEIKERAEALANELQRDRLREFAGLPSVPAKKSPFALFAPLATSLLSAFFKGSKDEEPLVALMTTAEPHRLFVVGDRYHYHAHQGEHEGTIAYLYRKNKKCWARMLVDDGKKQHSVQILANGVPLDQANLVCSVAKPEFAPVLVRVTELLASDTKAGPPVPTTSVPVLRAAAPVKKPAAAQKKKKKEKKRNQTEKKEEERKQQEKEDEEKRAAQKRKREEKEEHKHEGEGGGKDKATLEEELEAVRKKKMYTV